MAEKVAGSSNVSLRLTRGNRSCSSSKSTRRDRILSAVPVYWRISSVFLAAQVEWTPRHTSRFRRSVGLAKRADASFRHTTFFVIHPTPP